LAVETTRFVVIGLTVAVAVFSCRRSTDGSSSLRSSRSPQRGRFDAAWEQFRPVGGYVDAFPWRYWDDPAAVYRLWRDRAVRGAGRS
jgi:hypothetical protein